MDAKVGSAAEFSFTAIDAAAKPLAQLAVQLLVPQQVAFLSRAATARQRSAMRPPPALGCHLWLTWVNVLPHSAQTWLTSVVLPSIWCLRRSRVRPAAPTRPLALPPQPQTSSSSLLSSRAASSPCSSRLAPRAVRLNYIKNGRENGVKKCWKNGGKNGSAQERVGAPTFGDISEVHLVKSY